MKTLTSLTPDQLAQARLDILIVEDAYHGGQERDLILASGALHRLRELLFALEHPDD